MSAPAIPLPPADVEPRGWRLDVDGMCVDLPATEVVDSVRASGAKLVLLANNHVAAADFRREHGLPARQVVYATPASVRGWTDYEIVVLPRWHERKDAERTWDAMLPLLLCNRSIRAQADDDAR